MNKRKTTWERLLPKPKKPNYSEKEQIYHLEILPLYRQSAIVKQR